MTLFLISVFTLVLVSSLANLEVTAMVIRSCNNFPTFSRPCHLPCSGPTISHQPSSISCGIPLNSFPVGSPCSSLSFANPCCGQCNAFPCRLSCGSLCSFMPLGMRFPYNHLQMPCFGKQQCGQVCQNGNIQAETCGSNAIQYYNDMNNQCNSGQSGTTCFARRSPLFMNQCNECQKNDCFANTANTALDECCNKQDQVQQCNTCECTYDNIGNPGASCGLPVFMPPCGCAPMTPSVESKKCCESNNYEAAHCDNDACQFCSDESNEAQCGKQQQGSFNIITRRKRSPLVISNCAECQNEYAQSGSNNQAYSKCDDCQNQVSCCEDHQEEYTKIQK